MPIYLSYEIIHPLPFHLEAKAFAHARKYSVPLTLARWTVIRMIDVSDLEDDVAQKLWDSIRVVDVEY